MLAAVEVNEDLERLLRLAAHERETRNSPLWKRDVEDALEVHVEAVDALYAELYRQLDVREGNEKNGAAAEPAPNIRKELKR